MLTIPEASRRVRRNPETLRRWIREGRMRARKIGTQWFVEEGDLADATGEPEMVELPDWLRRTAEGEPMPNVVAWVHRSRHER